jgi:hypothetical protein
LNAIGISGSITVGSSSHSPARFNRFDIFKAANVMCADQREAIAEAATSQGGNVAEAMDKRREKGRIRHSGGDRNPGQGEGGQY